MQQYMIESPHTTEDCMTRLDELSVRGDQALAQWRFGCMAGDHTAYALIEAESEDAARQTIPPSGRGQAKVVPVNSCSAEQIKAFHKM